MVMRTFVLTALLTAFAAATADDISMNPDVSSQIERAIADQNIRAAAVGLYDNGEMQVIGFGQVRSDDSSTPRGDTIFEIGSITKVFTSILAQTQVDAGRLDWDDTIASHLQDVDFANDSVGSITLRELSSHTSGLPRLPDNMDPPDPMNPYKGYEREHLLAFVGTFDPGSLEKTYDYSNLGAGLLGTIAADAVELDYAQAMQKEVIQPLGMADTSVRLLDVHADRLAQGFSAGADMPNWDGFDSLAGAGALLSTANDMLLFIQQNLEPQALHDSLTAVHKRQAAGDTALGWHIANQDERGPVYWHNGGTGGYASFLAIQPASKKGLVILSASTEYNKITELGFAQFFGTPAYENSAELDAYPGAYEVADGFVLSVFIDGTQLFAQATGQGAFPLTSSAENEFVFPAADIRIVFEPGDDGSAMSLVLHQGGQASPAPRTGDAEVPSARTEIAVEEDRLQDYVGEYQLAPKAVLTILVRDGQLFAQLTGQAAYPVFAYDADRFFYKIVDAQLHFERDDEAVIAVVLHQGGKQRAPRVE
jgi:D-alanyl-D-alanine-carboxypeptidase/D-alanyl-D-alanine-endopeptidase